MKLGQLKIQLPRGPSSSARFAGCLHNHRPAVAGAVGRNLGSDDLEASCSQPASRRPSFVAEYRNSIRILLLLDASAASWSLINTSTLTLFLDLHPRVALFAAPPLPVSPLPTPTSQTTTHGHPHSTPPWASASRVSEATIPTTYVPPSPPPSLSPFLGPADRP